MAIAAIAPTPESPLFRGNSARSPPKFGQDSRLPESPPKGRQLTSPRSKATQESPPKPRHPRKSSQTEAPRQPARYLSIKRNKALLEATNKPSSRGHTRNTRQATTTTKTTTQAFQPAKKIQTYHPIATYTSPRWIHEAGGKHRYNRRASLRVEDI